MSSERLRSFLAHPRAPLSIVGGLTALFLIVGLWNLGAAAFPSSGWKADGEVDLDLGSVQRVDRVFFAVWDPEPLKVEVSCGESGSWAYKATASAQGDYKQWVPATTQCDTRHLRLLFNDSRATVAEVVPVRGPEALRVAGVAGPSGSANLADEGALTTASPTYLHGAYFDEIYFMRTADEYLRRAAPFFEWTHPPLGKDLIALSILAAGNGPFGWRLLGVLAGAAAIPAAYLLGRNLLGSRRAGVVTAALITFDFMHFAQARIATGEIFLFLFLTGMWACFAKWWVTPLEKLGERIQNGDSTPGRFRSIFPFWISRRAARSARSPEPLGNSLVSSARASVPRAFGTRGSIGGPRRSLQELSRFAGTTAAPWGRGESGPVDGRGEGAEPPPPSRRQKAVALRPLLLQDPNERELAHKRGGPQRQFATSAERSEARGAALGRASAASEAGAAERARAFETLYHPLFLAMVFFGLALSVKVVAIDSLAALLLLALLRVRKERDLFRASLRPFAAGLTVAGAIYLASYVPYYASGLGIGDVLGEQCCGPRSIFAYHATLEAPHPYGSPWWSWPLMLHPLWLYSETFGDKVSTIVSMGNPAVWWAGLAFVLLALSRARRDNIALFIGAVWLVQWAAFAPIGRVLFLYHYFPNAALLALGCAWGVERAWGRDPKRGLWLAAGLVTAAAVLFVVFYPVISGAPVDTGYKDALRWVRFGFALWWGKNHGQPASWDF